jgi:dTDP-4-dehydrorhamnose reductase
VSCVRRAWIINTAAYTGVDKAELEPAAADLVNGDGPGLLAGAARDAGAGIVHFSTDYIFDGAATVPYAEDAPPKPLGAYGRSKLRGEEAVRASGARHLIVRTQWLFGPGGNCFPRSMLARATARERTRVVSDQFGSPTYAVDVAEMLWRILGTEGVLHVVNAGVCSWFDVAAVVFDFAGAAELLAPCSSEEFPTRATRPRFSALDSRKLVESAGPLPYWKDSLLRFLSELSGNSAVTQDP